MVLVHGIGEHSGRYEHVGAAFADADIDVFAYDQRGFGQTGGKRAHVDDFTEFIDDLEPIVAEQRAAGLPLILMGHSLGGLIVATYLVSDRPQPDIAVLSAPALAAEVPKWQSVLAPILGTRTPKFFIKSKIDGQLLSRDPEVQQAYVNDPLVIAGATAGLGHQIFTTMEATTAAISKISVPTYVLHGEEDRLVPPTASEPLATLPNVTRVTWPGLRHECMNEPEQGEVLAGITDWLDTQLS